MRHVHLLNPMANACGGSEQRTASLFEVLAEYGPVEIWTTGEPDKAFYGRFPLQKAQLGRLPRGGTLVIVGAYFQIPAWVASSRFERVVLINNILNRSHLSYALATLKQLGYEEVEIVVTSRALRDDLEEQGLQAVEIQPSWIDISRFSPVNSRLDQPFTVGRMSRDVAEKFHSTDPELFRQLAECGLKVRLMGATCLEPIEGVEILPEGAEDAAEFLRSMDAFIYRTADGWFEAFGRVVFESMACGVVPVVHQKGGYAEFIEDKAEGFLWDVPGQAIEHLEALRADPTLLNQMSQAARNKTEQLYGPEACQSLVDFYFGR